MPLEGVPEATGLNSRNKMAHSRKSSVAESGQKFKSAGMPTKLFKPVPGGGVSTDRAKNGAGILAD